MVDHFYYDDALWTVLTGTIDGHTFWWSKDDRRIAISDQSGAMPLDTDDGILFIDTSQPIVLNPERETYYIPLIGGKRTVARGREVRLLLDLGVKMRVVARALIEDFSVTQRWSTFLQSITT